MGENNAEIIIRKATPKDVKGMTNLAKESFKRKNWIYTGGNKVKRGNEKKLLKSLKSRKPGSYSFVAMDKEKNKIVGSATFSFKRSGRLRHRIDMGWGIHPDYQGKGIGTRLVNETLKFAKEKGFKRAEAEMAIENVGSWKLALKCGFKIEGKKKKSFLTDDGQYIDTYIVGKIL